MTVVAPVWKTTERSAGPGAHVYWSLFAVQLILLAIPIFSNEYVPLIDYPNHLARMDILSRYGSSELYQRQYELDLRPIPNLAMDLIVPPLEHVVGLQLAGKLVLFLDAALFCFGCHFLATTLHGRLTWRAVILCALFYNSAFQWGFINYTFGLDLYLIALALILRYLDQGGAIQLIGLFVLAPCCYLAHLTGYLFLLVSCFMLAIIWFIQRTWAFRRLVAVLAALLPPFAVYVAAALHGGVASANPSAIEWNTISGKLVGFLAVTRTYSVRFDAILLLALVLICGIVLATSRPLRIAPVPAAIGAALLVSYLVLPASVNPAAGSGLDGRFIVPALLLLCMVPRLGNAKAARAALSVLFIGIFAIRLGFIENVWRGLSYQTGRIVTVLSMLPMGASLYPVVEFSGTMDEIKRGMTLVDAPCYLIPTKQIIDPRLWAVRGAQPIQFRHPLPFKLNGRIDFFRQYDYVWTFAPRQEVILYLAGHADLMAQTDGFKLWRLRKMDTPGAAP